MGEKKEREKEGKTEGGREGEKQSKGSAMSIIKESTVLVILGASGDLARKKLFPALFGLVRSSPFLPPAVFAYGCC